jgi:hypothetical protein
MQLASRGKVKKRKTMTLAGRLPAGHLPEINITMRTSS